MAGKNCNGIATDTPFDRQSRAYCEGRLAATNGDAQGTNPHPSTTVDFADWDRGWMSFQGGVGTQLQADCCAVPAFDGVP